MAGEELARRPAPAGHVDGAAQDDPLIGDGIGDLVSREAIHVQAVGAQLVGDGFCDLLCCPVLGGIGDENVRPIPRAGLVGAHVASGASTRTFAGSSGASCGVSGKALTR